MTAVSALGGPELAAAMVAYRDVLRVHRQRINRLNVFPVPDGDTGTNMALTLDAVVAELDGVTGAAAAAGAASMRAVCSAVAHGSLMGARGNSGVILSQLLRGITERFCDTAADADAVPGGHDAVAGPEALAKALVEADVLARKAVVRPVEGTILTVARAAGEGATDAAARGGGVVAVVEGAHAAAAAALEATPTLLEPLARAGVVDAGGAGYVLLFDALLHVLGDRPLPGVPEVDGGRVPGAVGERGPGEPLDGADLDASLRYEVMYLLDAPDDTIPGFKQAWADVGDSIVVVGGGGLWNCHIHTDDVGAAIEAAIDIGRPHRIQVTDLTEQVEEERWVRDAPGEPAPMSTGSPPATAVVAVVAGEGLGRIFHSLGVERLVHGGQSMNPSTADLLKAVDALASAEVVILPNNDNIVPVAAQVDDLTEKLVRVVPTGSIVEGFAALLAYDPGAGAHENASAMAASAAHVLPGAVTRAVRDADTDAGRVREGDWIGVSGRAVVAVGDCAADAAVALIDALIGPGHELVTLIEGDGATPAATRRITEWLHERHPDVTPEVHHGGQPLYPYLLGIE